MRHWTEISGNMKKEIDVKNNQIYIVVEEKIIPVKPPESGFGEQVVVWINGKIDRVDTKFTKKIKC